MVVHDDDGLRAEQQSVPEQELAIEPDVSLRAGGEELSSDKTFDPLRDTTSDPPPVEH
jgi:hypothetical protein